MEEVREAIGIDKVDMSGNLIFVEEHHKADANFIFHAITSHCRDKGHNICFVLFHNTFGHFHNVGMKLGYNLMKELNTTVKVVEPLKIIAKGIHNENKSDKETKETLEFDLKQEDNSELVKQIVTVIKNESFSMQNGVESKKLYLVIDDLSHLLNMGLKMTDAWLFLRYIRSFTNVEPNLITCIGSHVYNAAQDLCQENLLAVALKHLAQLVITVQPLESGYSRNVSGKTIIWWRSHEERLQFKWPEEMVYLFKLHDRQVKLFAPGSVNVL